jgi:hypothetical protein
LVQSIGKRLREGLQAQTLENDSVWEKVAPMDDKELEGEVTDLIVAYLTRSPAAHAAKKTA